MDVRLGWGGANVRRGVNERLVGVRSAKGKGGEGKVEESIASMIAWLWSQSIVEGSMQGW